MDSGTPDPKARNPLDHPWRKWKPSTFSGYRNPFVRSSETDKHYQRLDGTNGYARTFRKRNAQTGDRFARWGFDTPGCF